MCCFALFSLTMVFCVSVLQTASVCFATGIIIQNVFQEKKNFLSSCYFHSVVSVVIGIGLGLNVHHLISQDHGNPNPLNPYRVVGGWCLSPEDKRPPCTCQDWSSVTLTSRIYFLSWFFSSNFNSAKQKVLKNKYSNPIMSNKTFPEKKVELHQITALRCIVFHSLLRRDFDSFFNMNFGLDYFSTFTLVPWKQ